MNSQSNMITSVHHWLGLWRILIINEFKSNMISYLVPLPVLGWVILTKIFASHPFEMGTTGVLIFISCFAILAMVYGLQCFSNDSDKRTLDFIISRPIAPSVILTVKYLVNVLILLLWYGLFLTFSKINLALLPLPKGIGMEWITLLILVIHALGLLAGLLAKGLERIFVVIVTTLLITSASYYIWNKVFLLITANYEWYDIPQHQLYFLQTILPYYLAIIGLIIPLVIALWYLRNRIPLAHFTPAKITIGIWAFTLIILIMSEALFAPVLWPDKTAKYGDWHTTAGIIIASPTDPSYEFQRIHPDQKIKCQLKLTQPGHRPKIIYTGNTLQYPKFSPDGTQLLFSEAGRLTIMSMPSHKLTRLGTGHLGVWDQDGHQIIYARLIGPHGLSEIYQYNLVNRTLKKLLPKTYKIADLVWDSKNNKLYILDYKQSISVVDLKTLSEKTYPFEDIDKLSVLFGLTNHIFTLDPTRDNIVLGYMVQDMLKIYLFNIKTKQFTLNEELTNYRTKSGAPFMIRSDLRSILWPRLNGTYACQTTKFYNDFQHELSESEHGHAEHGEDSEHEEHDEHGHEHQ